MIRSLPLILIAILIPISCSALEVPTMKTTIQRQADRVWLDGVECWFIGAKQSSVHAAQEAISRALGEEINYDYLLGVSGLAFRMQVFAEGLCPSSPHSCCGYPCVDRSNQALPWKITPMDCKADNAEQCARLRKMVVESIDSGIPVQYGNEEDGLIIGYQKGGEEWVCLHPMRDEGKKSFVETNMPWGMAFFDERKQQMPDRLELERQSLKQALQMASLEKKGKYYVGLKAWESYIEQLQALDQADDKTRSDNMLGNAWIYECLVSYRLSAARYLRQIAPGFPAEAGPHLLRAAEVYENMANLVLTDADHCTLTVAPFPWSLKPGKQWTPEMRAKQVQRLQKALPLERVALREIEKALAATPE